MSNQQNEIGGISWGSIPLPIPQKYNKSFENRVFNENCDDVVQVEQYCAARNLQTSTSLWKTTSLRKQKLRLGERLPLKERAWGRVNLNLVTVYHLAGFWCSRACQRVMPHMYMSHVTHLNASCHSEQCIMSQKRGRFAPPSRCVQFFLMIVLFCLQRYAISFDKGMKCAQVEVLFRVLYMYTYIYVNSCCCRGATVWYAIPPLPFLPFFLWWQKPKGKFRPKRGGVNCKGRD